MQRLWIYLVLLCSFSCGPTNKQELQQHARKFCAAFAEELREIETREQLLAKEGRLKARFEELVDLLALSESLQIKVLQETPESQLLRSEFERVSALEGAREVLERVQREPLIRLAHLYERERGKSGEPLPLFVQR